MRNLFFLFLVLVLGLSQALPQNVKDLSTDSGLKRPQEVIEKKEIETLGVTQSSNEVSERHGLVQASFSPSSFAGGKKDKGMQNMYMMFMMCKTLISTLLMFVGPIIQVKGFFLSVIGTLINIARFVMMLKQSKQNQNGGSANIWAQEEEDRIGTPFRPSFPTNIQPNFIKRVTVRE